MNRTSPGLPTEDEVREVALSLHGYTVSARGRCLARVGSQYVMRDSAGRCVRIPVENANMALLGAAWANFNLLENGTDRTFLARDVTWNGTVSHNHVALVLHGYTGAARGVCLARVVGNYVTRDGLRHCIRFLVDTVDPVALAAAWAAFGRAAGWLSPTSVERTSISDRSMDQWRETGEKRRASG